MEFSRPNLPARTVQIVPYSASVISPLDSISFTTATAVRYSRTLPYSSLFIGLHLHPCFGEACPPAILRSLPIVRELGTAIAADMFVLNPVTPALRMGRPPQVSAPIRAVDSFAFPRELDQRRAALFAAINRCFFDRMPSAPALHGIDRKPQL